MRRLLYLLPVAALGVMALFFMRGLHMDPRLIPSVLINKPVPQMDLAPLPGRGDTGLSTADLKGRVTLVDIYGSWCIACLEEHPTLLLIKQSGVVPIEGIDWDDDPAKGAAWLRKNGDPYDRVGMDPAPGYTSVNFGVTGAPESFLVDKTGIIRMKYIGPITPEVWEKQLLPKIREMEK